MLGLAEEGDNLLGSAQDSLSEATTVTELQWTRDWRHAIVGGYEKSFFRHCGWCEMCHELAPCMAVE